MYCNKCGKQIPDDSLFCSKCGAPVQTAQNQSKSPVSGEYSDREDIESSKGLAVIAYFGILFFIPMVVKPNSKYCRFHSNQGLNFLIFAGAVSAIFSIAKLFFNLIFGHSLFGGFMGFYNLNISLISILIDIAAVSLILILFIIGIKNAVEGKMEELPIIGKLHILD